MEIEAKFVVPDESTFIRLHQAATIAGYSVSSGPCEQLEDTYLDTPSRRLLAARYALRRRARGEGHTARFSLKSLAIVRGAVHRREEIEASMPWDASVDLLPEGPLRERVLALRAGEALEPLVRVRQRRTAREIRSGGRQIAVLCLDRVCCADARPAYTQLVAEVELLPEGVEADLSALVACLLGEWDLAPQSVSKFQLALAYAGLESG